MPLINNSGKKCLAINLNADLFNKIRKYKEKTGKSQNSVLVELLNKGLDRNINIKDENKMYFFVKVRIDTAKMMELGQKLMSGELDTSGTIMTYCIENDPTVGLNIWQAKDQKHFEEIFAPHKEYYKDVIEVVPVVTPAEAMKLIMEKMQQG